MKPLSFSFAGKENFAELQKAMALPRGYLSRERIDLILHFLFDVLKPSQGELVLFPKNLMIKDRAGHEYEIHSSSLIIAFRCVRADGLEFVLGLEDQSLEINIPPPTIEGLEVWRPIYRLALRAGFVGHSELMPGGGGHMHLGFKRVEENVFLSRPDVLARFATQHLRHPEIMVVLGEEGDRGAGSTSLVPYDLRAEDRMKAEAEMRAWQRALEVLQNENLGGSEMAALREKFAANIPPFLLQHDAAVSLKHFAKPSATKSSVSRENPHAEVRYPRAFNSFGEVSATAQFLLHSLAYEFFRHPPDFQPDHWWSFQRRTPEFSHRWFRNWAQRIGMPPEVTQRLLRMAPSSKVPMRRVVLSNSLRGKVKVYRAPNSAPSLPHYVVALRIDPSEEPDTIYMNGRQIYSWFRDGDIVYLWLPYYVLEPMAYLISTSRNDSIIQTIAIEFYPINLTDHRIVISDRIPSTWNSQHYFELLAITVSGNIENASPMDLVAFKHLGAQFFLGGGGEIYPNFMSYIESGEALTRLHVSFSHGANKIVSVAFEDQAFPLKHFKHGWETVYYFDAPANQIRGPAHFLDANGDKISSHSP